MGKGGGGDFSERTGGGGRGGDYCRVRAILSQDSMF